MYIQLYCTGIDYLRVISEVIFAFSAALIDPIPTLTAATAAVSVSSFLSIGAF